MLTSHINTLQLRAIYLNVLHRDAQEMHRRYLKEIGLVAWVNTVEGWTLQRAAKVQELPSGSPEEQLLVETR